MAGTPSLEVSLLGPLEVVADGAPLVVDTRKALAIVALLAVEERSFARDELAALLWPDADDESARGALRRTLSSLRGALGNRWVRADRATVSLDRDGVAIDLRVAATLAESPAATDLAAAASLHRGPFLAGFSLRDAPDFDDWQAAGATAVAAQLSAILDRLAAAHLASGDTDGALAAARRRVDADSLDEAGQRRLIEVLALSGDRSGAIRQYRACVAVLDAELGVPPLAETTELYERIRDGRIGARPEVVDVEPAADGVRSVGAAPFVGRDDELRALLAAHGAAGDRGAIAVVEGEAGIGKTRLAEVFGAESARRGATVLSARCYPGEQAIAYGPIISLLRAGVAAKARAQRLESLSIVARAALATLAPETRGGEARPIELVPIDEPAARARLLDAIADGLTALSANGSTGLIWLDDLQWADEATLESVAYVARRLDGRSVLLLVTWRREDLDGTARRAAAGLERAAAVHVRLERLDRDAVVSLVAALAPSRLDEPGAIDALVTRSEGLPLYVIEALAAPIQSLSDVDAAVPTGVRALVAERLATLDGAASQLLAAAAVIGRSFDVDTLRQVSGRSEDEAVDGLDRLVQRGFVRETAEPAKGGSAFDFAHGSIRDVVLDQSSLARRRLLHRRAAEARIGRPVAVLGDPAVVDRLDGGVAAAVAAHLREAGYEREAALAHARAAEHAHAVHANVEAVAQARSAVALGHPEPGRLHALLGDLATLSGRYADAIAEYESAAAIVTAAGHATEPLADLEHRLALVHQRLGDAEAADAHFKAALDLTSNRAARARVLADRSLGAHLSGRAELADSLAADALAEADASGDDSARARAANVAGVLATERGDPAAGRALLERSLALAEQRGELPARVAALNNLARAVAAGGDIDRAIELTDMALAVCRSIGDRHREAALHNNLADLLRGAGRRDAAIDELKTAVAIFAEVGEPGALEPGKWRLATW